jgi:hypothetical protein
MLILLVFGAVFVFVLSAGQSNASVIMCGSFSCIYNRRARCTRKEISIYDNTVTGLCLDHSETMTKRIIEPLNKAIGVERSRPNSQMITKIMKAQEDKRDSELLNNPKAFAKWMKNQGIGGL